MRSVFTLFRWFMGLPLVAAAVVWPGGVRAQAFSADYALTRVRAPALFNAGPVRIGAAFQADARFSGAGLSLEAGRNWFGQVAVGHSLQYSPGLPAGGPLEDVFNISGGYRWSDGQSLSLQMSRSRGGERPGLSVSYDWPRYFLRLSYDPGLNLTPVDVLRFSAGMKF